MSEFGRIYIIECTYNKKLYVGLTTSSIKKRWNKHIYDSRHNSLCVTYKAVRIYNISYFTMKQISSTKEELFERETNYISVLKTHVNFGGYNEALGGEAPMLNRNRSTISRQKISKKIKREEISK